MVKNLRTFLSSVESKFPQGLVSISKEVDCKYEAGAILQRFENLRKAPAVLFENVRDLAGRPGHRVFMNGFTADRRLLAIAFDLDPYQWKSTLTREIAGHIGNRIKPVVIDKREAPVKEVIKIGEDVSLDDLPILTLHKMDANPYLTMPSITKKPGIGYNLTYKRLMYRSRNETGIHMAPFHTLTIYRGYEERNEPMPIVIVHGHHPAFNLAGAIMVPWPWDEYEAAGGVLNEPLRLTPSETWGDDFLVPADAEILIEGEVLPKIRKPEAPFGEFTGYYGPQRQNPVVRIKAITYRKDFIWCTVFVGHRDHSGIHWEAEIYRRVSEAMPGTLRAVHCPWPAQGFQANIAIKKMSEGDPMIAACAAQLIGYPKMIVVVDEDVDVFDQSEVLWAIATRFQADKRLTLLRNVKGSTLDPSSEGSIHATMIIDATKPVAEPFSEKVKVPEAILEKTRLEDYVDADTISRVPVVLS